MDKSIDISGLSPEKKRALLSQLLMEEAEESASVYPMSYGQRSMWFIHKLAPASAAYTVTYAARISGELNVPALERAAQALVDRHPMLRTTYAERDGQPVQLVHPQWPVRIARHHLGPGPVDDAGRNGPKRSRAISPGPVDDAGRNGPKRSRAISPSEPELDEWIRRETDRPFDLYTGPVLRLTLLERTPEEHVLLLVLHHIAVDFWSIDVILDELRMLYAAEHGAAPPPPPAESFVDYADQQTRMLAGAEGEDLWAYWREQLAGDLPVLQLPTDRPRPAVQTYPGTVHRFTVDDTVTAGLTQLGRSMGTTPYMTLLAAYATLLHRYSGQGDLVIGSPFACRDRVALEGLVGYLTNPVALRADLHDDPTFTALLGRVKDTVQGALEHQDYPFPLLVERLRPVRDPGRTPLFQVSFAWEQTRRFADGPGPETRGAAAGNPPRRAGRRTVRSHDGDGRTRREAVRRAAVQHRPLRRHHDRADGRALRHTPRRYRRRSRPASLAAAAAHRGGAPSAGRLEPNRGRLPLSDAPACLHEMVAATVARVPDAVAVTCDDRELTYAELDRRANGLAHRLRQLGVGPEIVVPVLLDRSEDLVVALLGVLKAGGAFLPLDSAQPAQRMAAILADVPDAPVCVTHQRHLAHVPPGFTGHRLCLDAAVGAIGPGRHRRSRRCDDVGEPRLRHPHVRFHRQAEGNAQHPRRDP